MLADYHPLTPYSLQSDHWIAWQFNRPESGDGVIQAFRRGECAESCMTFRLNGLDPRARYEITDFDQPVKSISSGKELMSKGLTVILNERPEAAVVTYRIAR